MSKYLDNILEVSKDVIFTFLILYSANLINPTSNYQNNLNLLNNYKKQLHYFNVGKTLTEQHNLIFQNYISNFNNEPKINSIKVYGAPLDEDDINALKELTGILKENN